ncbi:MAG: NADP-dependent malic enzyme [Aquificota bacterium]|nr:MAG: NADP-dependent malic enzyme [Aquificota bacterium]
MSGKIRKEEALEYHSIGRPGKIEVTITKPCETQRDLSLAYTPGVAWPCLEIADDPDKVFVYTAKGNLVAVVSNGTAVLGLGNIGALAGKPVMEGKGVLFKTFADVDVFDIEVDTEDPDELIRVVKLLEPTFGGINLEDIKAPECFYIEEKLKEILDIPVFHDDQHGTAIITTAGLLNALELVGKKPEDVRVAMNGAGAAGIAIAKMILNIGVKKENIIMCDSKGVIYKGRTAGMNPYKEEFAIETNLRTLEEAMKGADVFIGVSVKGAVTQEMVKSMAPNPIIFACANPDPEITPEEVLEVRKDAIMATGRSDYPNQVNNVLGFPHIFRGALDVRARAINEEMKVAAARALADLAKAGDVPEYVLRAYNLDRLEFGPDYIIPKPLDHRVTLWEATAVAKAAIETGVARTKIKDFDKYKEYLEARLRGKMGEVIRALINRAKRKPKRIVFPEGSHPDILRVSQVILDEKVGKPVLIGSEREIKEKAAELKLELKGIEIVDPLRFDKAEVYAQQLYSMRKRKGVTLAEARRLIARGPNTLGAMMLHMGDADVFIGGQDQHYSTVLSHILKVLKTKKGIFKASGVYIVVLKDDLMFFADTTVNIDPTAEDLAEVAICTAETARKFGVEPRVAMLSYSNFGSVNHPTAEKVRKATEIVKEREPFLTIDGEMQADTAVVPEILKGTYPFSSLKERANVLIFPNLDAGNIAYKLVHRLGCARVIGPILQGLKRSAHVLQRGSSPEEIFNLVAVAVVEAQEMEESE